MNANLKYWLMGDMSPKRKYWLMQARFGLVIAVGLVLAAVTFLLGGPKAAAAIAVLTAVLALLVLLLVDRKNAAKLPG